MNNKSIGTLWAIVLTVVALLVVVNVNFGFQEKMLRQELIEHTALSPGRDNICVCRSCGKSGFAYCAHCGLPMKWDKIRKRFFCSACSEVGNPVCPNCKTRMVGIESARNMKVEWGTGQPVPVF